ncbi:hypothetical protein F1559_002523 [Cyanidiococcus yangmingshanensis]|uniref:DNA ligase 1 n=1 Tax=Cyanidiococcus yangmingshanensis TaxID=2690220 RepID=A0A7J7II94_9RHOD|nr:hypothetical protein F1559_002523 [Cyanidiococcus yangmingshanensis]
MANGPKYMVLLMAPFGFIRGMPRITPASILMSLSRSLAPLCRRNRFRLLFWIRRLSRMIAMLVKSCLFSTFNNVRESMFHAADLKTNVLIVAFDILCWRNESLTRKTLAERRAILHQAFQAIPDGFRFAIARDVMDPDGIRCFMDEAVRDSCEGLMVKALDGPLSTYEPANRTQNWLKLKKDYLQGIGDTLDLVPIGAYYGRGKRTGWFGSFLLACYNPDTEQFEAVTRVGTGFSEEQMAQLHAEHAQNVLDGPRPYVVCSESVKPDVWLDPRQVWEVQCADLSLSPAYVAALGYIVADKGISVRFPRLVRIRTDKHPEEATTSAQLADMYRNQFRSPESSSSESSEAASDPEHDSDRIA